ncbi:hypothetical protein BDF20DRAFT_408413 [Mycotypha africana]|uniref:uncharacterized protein n=1 Tax=Mycotypha africana TaxID=64632 RepID=UPI0023012174|nr:uncharacterized protein BDF20DRAFT_408413 [Mycotypha africana]KAI8984774.1 hypothetical protein BDF20DRAFT_408413 [Mycotypha africana]
MTFVERDRCLRWRLGWLPNNYSTSCLWHPTRTLTKAHVIDCIKIHNRLQLPHTISDPIFFLLNLLPTSPSRQHKIRCHAWTLRWPTLQLILFEVDYLQHNKEPPTPPENLGQLLLDWMYAPAIITP